MKLPGSTLESACKLRECFSLNVSSAFESRMRRRILYFVGAGLTKSPEITGSPVPLMTDFVHVMAHYAEDDDVILTTLARLEVARRYTHRNETLEQLASKLLDESQEHSKEDVQAFLRLVKLRVPESVEDLLAKEDAEAEMPTRFRYGINRLFFRVDKQVTWEPLYRFLRTQFESIDTRHTFVSFNYDIILDSAIQHVSSN